MSTLPNRVKNKLFSIISDMESEAIHICMAFIRWRRKNPPDVEALIQKKYPSCQTRQEEYPQD